MQRFRLVIVAMTCRPAVLGSVVGALGFVRYQTLAIVDPTNVYAFIAGDWGNHMMGWLHFRNAPLTHLPLGRVPQLGYPLGTSLLLTDSIPLLALILRPFSALLPSDFQYLGLWLFASFVLQGVLGAQIASIYFRSRVAITASAALFVLLPAFLLRNVHPSLTAHWIILALLCGALRGPRRTRWGLVALVSMATLIHPYLWAFSLPLLLGVLLDDVKRGASGWAAAAVSSAACLAASLGLLALVGGFSSRFQRTTGGFGSASANLVTFFAPNSASRFLRWDTPPSQLEGFAYLGLGVIVLLAIVGVLSLRPCQTAVSRNALGFPVATGVAVVLLAAYALSDRIFVGNREVLTLAWLYAPIRPLAETFRVSGRAIWPLMYVLVVLGIGGLQRSIARSMRRPELTAAIVLSVCAGIQLVDVAYANRHDEMTRYFFDKSGAYFVDRLSDPRWQLIGKSSYRHMAVVPTSVYGCHGMSVEEGYHSGRINLLSLEAYRANLTFNSGYFSRWPVNVAESCMAQNQAASEHLAADTVYIFADGHEPPRGSRCDSLNGIRVCVSAQNDDPLARSLLPRRIAPFTT